ncbi:MAG: nucleotide exchange factor GrpE [Planctomycetota bacterium]|jgi:molecular chaperone GrpE|nr:nucleotide exchange factor GrpE [Planctomycetota bacterium]
MSNDHQGDREQQSVEPIDEAISEDRNESVSLEQQLADAQERLLRTQAELENYRKRARREYEEAQRYREIDLLRDLLPVLDNVLRAIEASTTTSDVESLRSGFRMTAQQIEKLLESHGCGTIATDGTPFDPTVHDAILQQPTATAAPGTIVGTASRGYKLHDRVVRPAQVIVATEP